MKKRYDTLIESILKTVNESPAAPAPTKPQTPTVPGTPSPSKPTTPHPLQPSKPGISPKPKALDKEEEEENMDLKLFVNRRSKRK